MTYDDGPYVFETELLDTLQSKGVKATFFVNGNNWGCIYDFADQLNRIINDGHQLAAHTWSHPDLTTVSDDEIRYQVTQLEGALRKITGKVPRYFRLPFGSGDARVLGILGELGYDHIIDWDFDSGDSLGASVASSEQGYNSLSSGPHICLNHETSQSTVEQVTPYAVDLALGRGYSVTTVGSCLGDGNWYKENGSPSPRDSTWVCTDADRHL